jgi:hypothetical protein
LRWPRSCAGQVNCPQRGQYGADIGSHAVLDLARSLPEVPSEHHAESPAPASILAQRKACRARPSSRWWAVREQIRLGGRRGQDEQFLI